MNTGRASWTVLDTDFGDGAHFLDCSRYWQNHPEKPGQLHYVGILEAPPTAGWPPELAPWCDGLVSGFQRLLLQGGRVSLTLCIGPLQATLSELVMQANTVLVGQNTHNWNKWTLKALAKLCQRHTEIVTVAGTSLDATTLNDTGFQRIEQAKNRDDGPFAPASLEYNPRWTIPTSRKSHAVAVSALRPQRCIVIGGGLSGASVAHAMAVRGWQVTVLDSHPYPAGGASGLPAGLVVPHVSSDDSPRSRMSRNGTRLMLHLARNLLVQGTDWEPSGVCEMRAPPEPKLWHPMAGWVKPVQLVKAWLAHPAIRFVGNSPVTRINKREGVWELHDANGGSLGAAEQLVFTNGFGCQALIATLGEAAHLEANVLPKVQALQQVHGTVSMGIHSRSASVEVDWPTSPVNGHGSFIPDVPGDGEVLWHAGATFETELDAAQDLPTQHAANRERLRGLLPSVADALAGEFDGAHVRAWTGSRCVAHDRLPLVGPLQDVADNSLWMCAGMGARGLSFSALCAQLLVAQLHGEPLPMEASLARHLSAQRRKRDRRPSQTF